MVNKNYFYGFFIFLVKTEQTRLQHP